LWSHRLPFLPFFFDDPDRITGVLAEADAVDPPAAALEDDAAELLPPLSRNNPDGAAGECFGGYS